MSVARDYFARVRPLLGEGLARHAVEVEGDPEVALPVIDLLASCMLARLIVRGDRALFDRYFAWKQPFAPLDYSARTPDARLVARRGPAGVRWGEREVTITVDPHDGFAHADLAYHAARGLRDALLGRTPWPVAVRAQPSDPRGVTADLAGKHVMTIGCGSLGSEAIRLLRGARFTLIDDAEVTVYNLARQWFGAADVGRPKVDALADRVAARTWRAKLDAGELAAFEARLRDDPPDVVMLATGTHHHVMIGELLWRLGIPHAAACCYPRARYFEVSVVSPPECTPCLRCFRGHLDRGVPDAPVPDEIAAFLYEPVADAERARRYTDLVAEPASKIETLRAAQVLARCTAELVSPRRSPWFARVIAEATTCLLGGNVAGAYGIVEPGQVLRLGVGDLAGTTDSVRCETCGRSLDVTLRDEWPAVEDEAADAALLV